ncbi:MAG: uncharacterized protein QG630_411, partial [Patescibacteria group bacterium]|nr:uncharacterized protein [Patescibacteria group bacterium]
SCKKKGKRILFLLVVFLAVYLGIVHAVKIYTNSINPHTIVVMGTGEINAVPDISVVSFTVRSSDTNGDTQKLQADLSSVTANLFPKLKALGIDEKDIETTNYSVNPKYGSQDCSSKVQTMIYPPRPCNTSVVVGYEASESVNVKIRDTQNVGKVLAAIAEAKITEVNGPNFQIDNPEKLKADARAKAIADAKDKAKVLAKSLGVRLDKIISFSDNDGGYYPMMYKASAMDVGGEASSAPNIAAGEQKITSNVSITFEIDN